jgi:hypothetical protein
MIEKQQGSNTIVLTIIGILAAIGLIGGAFILGQATAKNTNSTSSSSTITQVSSSGNSSSSMSSSTSSSSTTNTIKTFSNSELPKFSFKYDSAIWSEPAVTCFYPSEGCVKELGKNINLSRKDGKGQLIMRLASEADYPYKPIQLVCFNDDSVLDIGNTWFRVRVPNLDTAREFTIISAFEKGTPPLAANRLGCDATGVTKYAPRELSVGNIYKNQPTYLNVNLNFSDANNGVADDIVKTITYK